MKIVHKSKKPVPPPPQVSEFIKKLTNASAEEITNALADVEVWKWPRSDLNAWIKVLNRFDTILEDIIKEYDLDKLQLKPFTPASKQLVSEILRFERLLMENSTNRKTYNSYDRLNSLLFTSDLDVLILALNLLLRPSQQYSAQPAVSHALSLSSTRLQSLAKKWPHVREYGTSLADLVSAKGDAELEGLPIEAREVNVTFYRTDAGGKEENKPGESSQAVPETPRKASASSSGAVHVYINEQTVQAKPPVEVLADAIKAYGIPDEEKYEILCRIRTATGLAKGHRAEREKLLIARLLAIAIYSHTHPESQATSTLFVYEPDLITHISELLQVDNGVPIAVQTAALGALDALARYRNRIQEVLTAVNAAVNHGILMGLFRKSVNDLANQDSTIPHSFVEALLGFMTFIVSHASGVNMVVGAGLIPLLIQLVENKSASRLATVSRTMQLLDNVLYSYTNGFHIFCSARGVDVVVERIEYEVDYDIEHYGDGAASKAVASSGVELPVTRIAVLKHILRSMHRMMQSAGTAEGLRNLINLSLLKTIKKIIEYRGLFGPSILPFGINIMSTFVHNEPTSLAIIQEAGLPEAFYKAIEAGIEPAIEVIQAIPNAIGALCLNEIGQAQLAKRPSIIPAIFMLFTSERHLKVLIDKENAVLIGTAIDELIRHHPSLKAAVFESLKSTLSRIEDLGLEYTVPSDILHWYQLSPLPLSSDADVSMEVDEEGAKDSREVGTEPTEETGEEDIADEESPSKSHDNIIVSYIDVLGRFLEGLFQHTPHCRDFITATDGLARLGRLTSLPCLPYDFANSVASDSMVQVMRTMTEVATNETLLHLSKFVKSSLNETEDFWKSAAQDSKLLPFIDVSNDGIEVANAKFRSLVTLHIRITLLSDVFATAGYAHGRAAIGLLQTLMSNTSPEVVADLGALHRASIWENILLNAGLASKGIDVSSGLITPLEGTPEGLDVEVPEQEQIPNAGSTANGIQPEQSTSTPAPRKPLVSPSEPRFRNATALKHITHGLPNALAPFFQAMVKTFHARRNPDGAQKKQIQESSKIVADIMLKHLQFQDLDGDRSLTFTYYTVVLGLFTLLLIEERSSSTILHTVELFAFYKAGGLDALFKTCDMFMERIKEISVRAEPIRTESEKKELIQAYGGLKVALHLLQFLISSKALIDSNQSHLIATKDKKDTDPDYFEQHNFLVKLRLAALPTVHALWMAPWIIQAPLGVSRAIVRTMLELTNGEGEESRGEVAPENIPSPASIPRPPPPGPDEARVRMLTDMGFPRSAAERALIRMHNNVNAATELLLSQPFPLPPDPDPETDPATVAQGAPVEDITAEAPANTEETGNAEQPTAAEPPAHTPEPSNVEQTIETERPSISEEATIVQPPATAAGLAVDDSSSAPLAQGTDQSSPPGRTADEWRSDLNKAREPLIASISRQALVLIDEHQQLLFDLHSAFTRPRPHQKEAIQNLVDDIKEFSPQAYDVQEQPLANRCRLLALVLCESPSVLNQELSAALVENLLALLSSIMTENPPKWLAAHLLVLEALFTLSDEPRSITLPKEGEPIVDEPIPVGPSRMAARNTVFKLCLRLLSLEDLHSDELLSVLRLLVLFTRNREMADHFIEADGPAMLFKRLRASAVSGGSSYIATILRHLVEDPTTIRNIMQHGIKRYFNQPRTRVVEIGTYVKNCSSMALRDIDLFIDATKSLCQLGQPFSMAPHISLQAAPSQPTQPTVKADTSDMQVDAPPASAPATVSTPSIKLADAIVHLLVTELIANMKIIHDSHHEAPVSENPIEATPSTAPAPAETHDALANPPEATTDDSNKKHIDIYDKYQYVCFIMQCLAELLLSYDSCKVAFLSYSPKKKLQTPAKESANRFRSTTLQFLLSDLITFGTINPQPDNKNRNKVMLCNWAMTVVIALCAESSASFEAKEVSPDLASVRKYVLETISRATKDLPVADSLDSKYGRLLALAELCHRLLTVRFNNPPAPRKPQTEIPTHVAKIMLEKNFVATLTSSLSEIDLNYPHIRSLVTAILRPLQYLSKVAIKMSRSTSSSKADNGGDGDESASDSSMSEGEEEQFEEHREETPDLYRNSALGMYGGEMDDGRYQQDEEMDGDVEDTDEDVEMEFGDETGSEDTSNTDEDEHEDEIDDEQQNSGDAWDEGDEEDEEGLIENNDGNEEDEDEDEPEGDEGDEIEDDEEEGEGEMMWEDVEEEGEGLEQVRDEFDEDEEPGGAVPIQIIHDEDEADMGSDEEYALENGFFNFENVFNFENALLNAANGRDGSGFFVQRRHRGNVDEHVQLFGRQRNPAVPAPEATVHPLLLNTSAHNRPSASQPRSSRQAQRFIATGAGSTELLATLDEVISSGGGLQVLQQIVGPRGTFPEAFRLDVPAATFANLDRGSLPPRRGQGIFSAAIRVERAPRPSGQRHGREFEPLLTVQRWTEETKILHGDFVAERIGKLINHVTLALLPAAVEASKQAKLRQEEAARIEQEKAKARAESESEARTDAGASATEPMETEPTQEQPPIAVQEAITAAETPVAAGNSAVPSQVPELSRQTEQDQVMADVVNNAEVDAEMVDVQDDSARPVTVSEGDATNEAPAEPSSSSAVPSQRVTVMIHGNVVDITDTGIDPTFLEALPDEMREEVLNQHVRDQRAARVERPPDSQISSEFLDALPPEIRAEILQQEAIERARRHAEEAVSARGPAEIDPASFIASLDPTLRQAVLLEQDDGFIATLPSHMIAEAETYRGGLAPRRRLALRGHPGRSLPPVQQARKPRAQHDAIQLLDKAGIAILVRLLFFPQVLRKTLLFKVLVNLCENSKARTELFNLLLNILQDGTGDLAAVDKSFAQMSVRNSKPQTPKSAGKQKPGPDYLSVLALPVSQIEAFPDLIAQKCLDALTYIVSANELASLFFLTEHELPAGLRKSSAKKGKGKEKQAPQSHYPIVLLLGLLDRQSLLRTPAIMESVVGLLATVTRPLTSLKDTPKAAPIPPTTNDPQAARNSPNQPQEASTAIPESNPQAAPAPSESLAPTAGQPVVSSQPTADNEPKIETVEEKVLLANPPQIPHAVLRLIVNILTIGECSGRTFQQSLALIQHLSYIPDARDVIAQELKAKAQEFGHILISDLEELAKALQDGSDDAMTSCIATKFSPASSPQAKLLRVLKTIDYMYTPKPSSSSGKEKDKEKAKDIEKVQSIYETFRFSNLWRKLGDCLSIIGEKPDTEHIAMVLLPLIESLMVVCKYVGSKAQSSIAARALRGSASPRSPITARESMEELFISFTDAHRKVLNLMVRNNPSLMSGSFSLLVNNPRVLDFDNKRNYFSQQLHRRPHMREHHGTLQLNVRRARVFEDSFQYLQRKTGEQIKHGKLNVRFYDEEGVDAGGVTREWFQILARQMFDPNNALFQPCAADKLTYQPNKNSWVNPEHLSFFKFVGRVIGKAIYDGRLLDAYFARSLYRQLLGKPVDYKDVEWVDPEYYKSLCWILENDPTILDLTFSVEADEFGVNRVIPLKEGGEQISVTMENRREFVQLSAQYRLYSSIKDQIESFSNGFYEIIPKDLITIFNEQELELLISGTPDIDVDEWRAATEYVGYNGSDPNIVWWWRALKSFNRDERAKVLSFATGTSRVPLNGFTDLQGVQGVQRFSIHRAYGENDRLPQAHTCFNQIDLPQYSSYDMLRQQLLLAINEGGEGFAFS